MTYADLKKLFGTNSEIGRLAGGVSPQAVSAWAKQGVPDGQQFRFYVLTGGFLPVDPALMADLDEVAAVVNGYRRGADPQDTRNAAQATG